MVLKENTIGNQDGDTASGKLARWVEPADGWLLVGCILSGTMILGPIGPIVLGIAFWKLYKSVKAGTNARPWAATIIGTFCLVDGLINFSPWTFDTFAHNTVLGETFITGYGRFFDGVRERTDPRQAHGPDAIDMDVGRPRAAARSELAAG